MSKPQLSITAKSEFKEIRMLGSGRTSKVFLCESPRNKTRRALKKKSSDISQSIFEHEVQMISQLCHPNIIEVFPTPQPQSAISKTTSTERNSSKKREQTDFIIMEYASEGDFFEFAFAKRFEPKLARYYMIQLLNVLDYMHQLNIYHRDLKLENLFLDDAFQLKLGDFGLAASGIQNSQQSSPSKSPSLSSIPNEDFLSTSSSSEVSESQSASNESMPFTDFVGTENYMAPELLQQRQYKGDQVDIFAFGVVLFSLIHGFPPYPKVAHHSDPFYRLLMEQNYNKYWSLIERKTGIHNDDQFKDLIARLLDHNPATRITLEEIKRHPWMHGEIYSQQEINSAMNERKRIIQKNQPTQLQQ